LLAYVLSTVEATLLDDALCDFQLAQYKTSPTLILWTAVMEIQTYAELSMDVFDFFKMSILMEYIEF
jgi:hypothetical protein